MFSKIKLISSGLDLKNHIEANKKYFVFASEEFDFENLNKYFQAAWMGAVFPQVIYKDSIYKNKALLCELNETILMEFISDENKLCFDNFSTSVVIVDGLDPNLNSKLEELFSNTKNDSIMFGGGAGRAKSNINISMYNGESYIKNGTILLNSNVRLSVGIKHGYICQKDFHMITKAKNNVIEEIDGKKAFAFYKDFIKEKYDLDVNMKNIFEVGVNYPFMVERIYGEKVVRVPLETDGVSLFMGGEVFCDTVVSLGKVSNEDLVKAAQESVILAKKNMQSSPRLCITFSCAGREKYSTQNFLKELNIMNKELGDALLCGVLSIGEIANNSEHIVEFFNSTCIVGLE